MVSFSRISEDPFGSFPVSTTVLPIENHQNSVFPYVFGLLWSSFVLIIVVVIIHSSNKRNDAPGFLHPLHFIIVSLSSWVVPFPCLHMYLYIYIYPPTTSDSCTHAVTRPPSWIDYSRKISKFYSSYLKVPQGDHQTFDAKFPIRDLGKYHGQACPGIVFCPIFLGTNTPLN